MTKNEYVLARAYSNTTFPYGVGLRILSNQHLVRQIRADLRSRTMTLADIARLENVSPRALRRVLELSMSVEEAPALLLCQFAHRQAGYDTVAWRTSRKQLSKRHVVGPGRADTVCTSGGGDLEWLDSRSVPNMYRTRGNHIGSWPYSGTATRPQAGGATSD